MKKMIIRILVAVIMLASFGFIGLIAINGFIIYSSNKYIINLEQAKGMDADCILVLGAKVMGETLSHVLFDRVSVGIELYEEKAAPNIIMSGDHGQEEYDEVNAMKNYAQKQGVLAEDIFLDHAGFSTYESMYRAKEIFSAKKILIVTQTYHLYRSIYIARAMGMEAYGVASDLRPYMQQVKFDIRELFARGKDFLYCMFMPKPTYLGDPIDLNQSAEITHDK